MARKNSNNITPKKTKGFKKMQINLTIGVTLRKINLIFNEYFLLSQVFFVEKDHKSISRNTPTQKGVFGCVFEMETKMFRLFRYTRTRNVICLGSLVIASQPINRIFYKIFIRHKLVISSDTLSRSGQRE